MMRPRWHKVFSDLAGNWIRSLLVVASIAVGLFAVGIIATNYFLIRADMRASYMAANPANIQIQSPGFDEDFVTRAGHMEGVRQAEGVRIVTLRVRTGENEWKSIDVQAVDDPVERLVDVPVLVEGSWPGERELVIDQYKLPEVGARVGDEVEIKLPSGKIRRMRLVGVMHDQTIGATGVGGGFFLANIQGLTTTDTLEWLEQPDSYNKLNVTVAPDQQRAQMRAVADRLTEEFESNYLVALNAVLRASNAHPNSIYVDAMATVLFMLGLLVVFLSSFLITNTLSALLTQQVQQIGIMKIVGGRRRQIATIYIILIFVYSLLALLIAVPLADRVAYRLVEYVAGSVNFIPQGFRASHEAHLIQIIIALLVPPLAGLAPILRGVAIPPQQAISGIAANQGKRSSSRLKRLRGFSRPMLVSLRNIFRSKGRLALTLITLSMGGAIFIATFNVQSSLTDYINRLHQYFIADVVLTTERPYRISEVESVLRQLPEVEQVEGWELTRGELVTEGGKSDEAVSIFAPPAGSDLIEPILLEGRWLDPADENAVALNEGFRARFPDLRVGDTLRLKIKGEESDWTVVGFFQLAGKSAGYVAYVNREYLAKYLHSPQQASMFRVTAWGDYNSISKQEALGRELEQHLEDNGFAISSVDAGLFLLSASSRGLTIITVFLLIMALLTALVGSIGLTGTMSMNVLERTREIGILRAVGASDAVVTRLVMVEGLAIGLISWLVGSLLSFPITTIMANGISQALFDAPSSFAFNALGFAIWFLLVVVLAVVASAGPARNAVRITIREALAYE